MRDGRIPDGFTEQRTQVGDVAINYVRGGAGEPLVLLHGYPQTWFMWRTVLPALAERYTVVAPDLRGAGGSDAPADGYDKATLAADLRGLLGQLRLDRDLRLVGHDIGTMVAYAYAAANRDSVRKLVLCEAPIPDDGLYALPALTQQGPAMWNFGFFSLRNGLPEQAVRGHEVIWVDRFMDAQAVQKSAIIDEAVQEYAHHLKDAAHLRASFEWFRALGQDIAANAENVKTKLAMPVLALGASGSLGDSVASQVRQYASTVSGDVIAGCGHWLFEERPHELTDRLLTFLR